MKSSALSQQQEGPSPTPPSTSNLSSREVQRNIELWNPSFSSSSPDGGLFFPDGISYNESLPSISALPAFTIPAKHDTMAVRVLALPQIKALVGEYPLDYFYNIEARRPISWNTVGSELIELPILDNAECDILLTKYLSKVYVHHPIIERSEILSLYSDIVQNGFDWSVNSGLILLILALGAVSSELQDTRLKGRQLAGPEYFKPAYRIIWDASASDLSANTTVAQGLVLAGLYMAYIARPLNSWKFIHAASTSVQLSLARSSTFSMHTSADQRDSAPPSFSEICARREVEVRIFWSCFLIECDRLAEFELPRSGIESIVDDMPLPTISDPADSSLVYFLAEISIRRLLNRVHNSLYIGNGHIKSLTSLLKICEELNRQLELWYDSIPEPVRPDLSTTSLDTGDNDRESVLRIRYYATRHIIFRPFVLRVINCSEEDYGIHRTRVFENCCKCLESIRNYIYCTGYLLRKPTPYTWTLSQSLFGAILVITAAAVDGGVLKEYVPDVRELQDIVLKNIRPWTEDGNSITNVVRILEHIQWRQG